MKNEINYSDAIALLDKYIKSPALRYHNRETEVIMRSLAKHFSKNEDLWGITGLLHDLDLEEIGENLSAHGYRTVEILKENAYEIPEMFEAIIAHTEGLTDAKRKTDFDIILASAENITGMITAYVLILPDKKIAGIKSSSIKKRLKQLRFAASVNRDFIYDIEKTGLSLDEFLDISILAMQEIAEETGM
jgi:predicted hydrolase (HD superfamily)